MKIKKAESCFQNTASIIYQNKSSTNYVLIAGMLLKEKHRHTQILILSRYPAGSNHRSNGRSSDSFRFVKSSQPKASDMLQRIHLLEITAAGTVPDLHWIPF